MAEKFENQLAKELKNTFKQIEHALSVPA